MAPSLLAVGTAALACVGSAAAKQWYLQDSYDATNFFDKFDFVTEGETGFAHYQNKKDAFDLGLAQYNGDEVYLGIDHKTVLEQGEGFAGRPSVRIESKAQFNHGLFIARFSHLPESKCGTWPGFFTFGAPWPTAGGINIYSGSHESAINKPSLHTGNSKDVGVCRLDGEGQTAPVSTDNCDDTFNNTPLQAAGQGCSAAEHDGPFATPEGGVYAVEWTNKYIKLYSWKWNSVPANINSEEPNTDSWGAPSIWLKNDNCEIDDHFVNQRLALSLNLCGANAWSDSCQASTGAATCADYVSSKPADFANSYFKIKDIRYFKGVRALTKTTSFLQVETEAPVADLRRAVVDAHTSSFATGGSTTSTRGPFTNSSTISTSQVSTSSSATTTLTDLSSTSQTGSQTGSSSTQTGSQTGSTSVPTGSQTGSSSTGTQTGSSSTGTQTGSSSSATGSQTGSVSSQTGSQTGSVSSQTGSQTGSTGTISQQTISQTGSSSTGTQTGSSSTGTQTGSSSSATGSQTGPVSSQTGSQTGSVSSQTGSQTGSVSSQTGSQTGSASSGTQTGSVSSTKTGSEGPVTTTKATGSQTGPITGTSSVEMTTSTVYTTVTETVTKCPPGHPCTGVVVTKTIPWYTTVCPVTATPTGGPETITETITKVYTITACPPEVKDCPIGKVITKYITTTYCPGGDKPTKPVDTPAEHTKPPHQGDKPHGPEEVTETVTKGFQPPAAFTPEGKTKTVYQTIGGGEKPSGFETVPASAPNGGKPGSSASASAPAGAVPSKGTECNGKNCPEVVTAGAAKIGASVAAVFGLVAMLI